LAAFSQLAGFADLGRSITTSRSPVNDLAAASGAPGIGLLLDLSIAASFLACVIASTTALVRVLFTLAREGVLPSRFGRTHARFRTPVTAAAVAVGTVTVGLITAILLSGSVWTAMTILIVGAASGYITAYLLVCLAAPVFLWRLGELTVWPVVRALTAALLLGAVLSVFLVAESATERAAGVWVFLATLLVGISFCVVRLIRDPWLRHTVGVYDVPVAIDTLGGLPPAAPTDPERTRT
ncbi:MAG: amino acid permease, partial [Cryobacterium sp.]|nr:amino acid permease [Cryobacterium sp.]